MKKKGLLLFALFILLIIILCIVFFSFNNKNKENRNTLKKEFELKKLKIIDEDSNSRSYAVMINNINTVWGYQSGLQDAYIIYEMMVEGGYTRLMAVFKDKNLSRIGTVRSSRHYFLDYAKENDAIYVHFGWSPQAQRDINTLKVDNINFMTYEGYIRDASLGLSTEHTVFTTTDNIIAGAKYYNYKTTTNQDTLLNYSVKNIDLSKNEDSVIANNIEIKFSNNHITSYTYDSVNKIYLRNQNNIKHIDYVTKKQYTFKNIIVYQVNYTTISGDTKGRQTIDNVGSGKGYYITNGYAVPITYEKNSRSSQTVYKYLDGKEINVNDGNTFIEISPINRDLTIN